jgi:hypothetical protein
MCTATHWDNDDFMTAVDDAPEEELERRLSGTLDSHDKVRRCDAEKRRHTLI